jgi:hypothetical protein
MTYRCKDLGVFDDRQTTNIYKQISYKKWRTIEPLDGENGLPIEEPVVLSKLTDLLLDSGKVSAADVALEAGPSPETLSQILGTDRLRVGLEAQAETPDFFLK